MPTFNSSDFDNNVSSSGVVHENVANTDHLDASELIEGYSYSNPLYGADLVGYWPMDENSGTTCYDFSGNNNDGTINGATVNQTGLLQTSAYDFELSNGEWVDLPNTWGTLFNGSNPFTVTAWATAESFPADQTPSNAQPVFNTQGVRYLFVFQLGDNSPVDAFNIRVEIGGTWYTPVSTNTISTNTWYFVTVTYDPNNGWKMYLNGTQQDSNTTTGTINSSTEDNALGYRARPSYWDGKIDDVRIYNRVLSSSEIQALYDVVNTKGSLTTQFKSV